MSYILDALEKSEKKRKGRTIPDLQTIHEPVSAIKQRRPAWTYFIAGALALNVLVVLWWVKPWEQPVAGNMEPQPVQQTAVSEEQLPNKPVPQQTVTSDSSPKITEPEHAAETITRSEILVPPKSASKPEQSSENLLAEQTIEPQSQIAVTAPDAQESAKTDVPRELLQDSIPTFDNVQSKVFAKATPQKSDVPIISHPEKALQESTKDTEQDEIPLIHQLPSSVRKKLPKLKISYLAYSHNPSARLASINGRIVRQGQMLSNDVKIEEITEKGVILLYKKQRFRMEIF